MKIIMPILLSSIFFCTGFLGFFESKSDNIENLFINFCELANKYRNTDKISEIYSLLKSKEYKSLPEEAQKSFVILLNNSENCLRNEEFCKLKKNNNFLFSLAKKLNPLSFIDNSYEDSEAYQNAYYSSINNFISTMESYGVSRDKAINIIKKYNL